jgi:hypothetical protein
MNAIIATLFLFLIACSQYSSAGVIVPQTSDVAEPTSAAEQHDLDMVMQTEGKQIENFMKQQIKLSDPEQRRYKRWDSHTDTIGVTASIQNPIMEFDTIWDGRVVISGSKEKAMNRCCHTDIGQSEPDAWCSYLYRYYGVVSGRVC